MLPNGKLNKIYTNPELTESFEIPTYHFIEDGDDKIIVDRSELLNLISERDQKIRQDIFKHLSDTGYKFKTFEKFLENFDFEDEKAKEKYGNAYIGKPHFPSELYLAYQAFSAGRE